MLSEVTAAFRALGAVLVATAMSGVVLDAQQPAAGAAAAGEAPAVGALAPDFTLPGATRYGLLEAPVRLSDYRGETVVLAFFFKARTKG